MNPIRNFIFAEATAEDSKQAKQIEDRSVKEVSSGIIQKPNSFFDFLDALTPYITDKKYDANRLKSYELFNRVLKRLPANYLIENEVSILFKLLSRALITDVMAVKNVSATFVTLKNRFIASKTINFLELLVGFFEAGKFNTISYVQEVRNDVYQLLLSSLNDALTTEDLERQNWLKQNQNLVIKVLLDQTEGEKDPRNLVIVLEIWDLALTNFDAQILSGFNLPIFSLLSVYFPITFENSQNRILVDRQYLTELLNACLTAPPIIGKFLELILEKLDEDDKEEKTEVMKSLKVFFNSWPKNTSASTEIHKWLSRFSKKLDFFLFNLNDASFESSAKELYEDFIKFLLNFYTRQGLVDWIMLETFRNIVDRFCKEMFDKPNGKNALACFAIFEQTIIDYDSKFLFVVLESIVYGINKLLVTEKSVILTVFLENVIPLTFKVYFNKKFTAKEVTINTEDTLRRLIHLALADQDPQKQRTFAKVIAFLVRLSKNGVCKEEIALDFQNSHMLLLLTLAMLSVHKDSEVDIAEFALSHSQHAEVLETILFYNFVCPSEVIMKLYLKTAAEAMEAEMQGKLPEIEQFEHLTVFMERRLDGVKLTPQSFSIDLQKIAYFYNPFEISGLESKQLKNKNKLRKRLLLSLLGFFSEHKKTIIDTFKLIERRSFGYLRQVVEKHSDALDGFDIHIEDDESLSDVRFCKLIARLIELRKLKPDEKLMSTIRLNMSVHTSSVYILKALLKLDFEKFSPILIDTFNQFIGQNKFELILNSVQLLMNEQKHKSLQAGFISPLFNQKLILLLNDFMNKNVSTFERHLFFNIKLDIVSYQIKTKMIEKKDLRSIVKEVSSHIRANQKDLTVVYKFLALIGDTIETGTFEANDIESEDFEQFFDYFKNSSVNDLKFLAMILLTVDKIITHLQRNLNTNSKKVLVCSLKKLVGHPKRIIRKLAGIALNNFYIVAGN